MKKILFLMLLMLPSIVNASTVESFEEFSAFIFMEAFVSIHMSLFVLKPLSEIFAKGDSKKLFWKLFWIRVAVLLICDIFITPLIAVVDFIGVFVGGFIVVPICRLIKNKGNVFSSISSNVVITSENEIVKCSKCHSIIKDGDKFCENCGEKIVEIDEQPKAKVAVSAKNFDLIYSLPEETMVQEFILRELKNNGIDDKTLLIPKKAEKRKIILNVIFAILVFIYISLIFFHFPILTYIIGLIILIIFYRLTRKFDLMKYLIKEVKSRPSEKISNIVMSVKQTLKVDSSKNVSIISLCIAVIIPLIIFFNPHVMYEKVDNGYAVRFYTFGVNNFKTASIPDTYKGEKVVELRGNTFSNMFFLKEVILPNSVVEIRGQAFKNAISLEKVNIPTSLEYLGGGAFYNAVKITNITLPDSLSYIGGEAFYNAKSLVSINLPSKISEIKGSTFENCKSLESINIPDRVVRIGGHAFYGSSSLKDVRISENSELNEIGSSAFRLCDSLFAITLPSGVYVNERAFKESPTTINYYDDKLEKRVVTIYKDGINQYINTEKYGKIILNITDARVENGFLRLNLQLLGEQKVVIDIVCDGSTYYVYDDFYIVTYPYTHIASSTTFDFYY